MSQRRQVKYASVDGSVVDLKVASMDHSAKWSADSDSHGIRNAVTNPKPRSPKGFSDLMDNSWVDRGNNRISGGTALFQLRGNQTMSQPGRIDRTPQLRQDEWQRTNVVFVPMSDEDRPNIFDTVH